MGDIAGDIAARRRPFVGIQVEPVSLLQESPARVVESCERHADVSAILFKAYAFTSAAEGRTDRVGLAAGQPSVLGGAYFVPHRECYAGTPLKVVRTREPAAAGRDLLQEVLEAAHPRGVAVYAWLLESAPPGTAALVPGYAHVLEVDALGRPAARPCFNHPDYRHYILAYVEDVLRHYEVAGVMWAAERRGPLLHVLRSGKAEQAVCFCTHCRAAGRRYGIDPERARQGYLALARYAAAVHAGERPPEGTVVPFLRLLLTYHEILAWEHLWTRSKHAVRAAIYGTAKAIDPRREVGWHLLHQRSFSPLLRAALDYADLAPIADWIKPALYDNAAGARFRQYVLQLHGGVLGDLSPEQIAAAIYRINGLDEGPLDEVPATGWSPAYVAAEVRQAVARLGPDVPLYAGIGIDVPSGPGGKRTAPDDADACVRAAIDAGARGIILSRRYAEMEVCHLKAVGAALRDAGWR